MIFFLGRRTRPPYAAWSAHRRDPSVSWQSPPPSSRRGDWGTTARGCDGLARSFARARESRAAAERSDPDSPWRRGYAERKESRRIRGELESVPLRRMFSDRESELSEPPSRASIIWQRLCGPGVFTVFFCVVSVISLISGLITGIVLIPGRQTVHVISFAESPLWFGLAMLFNVVVTVLSAGYVWFRVLGR